MSFDGITPSDTASSKGMRAIVIGQMHREKEFPVIVLLQLIRFYASLFLATTCPPQDSHRIFFGCKIASNKEKK